MLIGGIFTWQVAGKDFARVREKDIGRLVTVCPGSMGFMGSDTFESLNDDIRSKLRFESLVETAVRFALLAPSETAGEVQAKLVKGEPLDVVTSFQKLWWNLAGSRQWKLGRTLELGGSIEVMPRLLPGYDAAYEIVDSGKSMERERLDIVADNLGTLAVGSVWPKKSA